MCECNPHFISDENPPCSEYLAHASGYCECCADCGHEAECHGEQETSAITRISKEG